MNKLQNLYEKINPKDTPETLAKRIIARSEAEKTGTKTRRPMRLAAAACIAAVAAVFFVAIPVTASAMAGSNILEIFKSYFNTQELNPVGTLEYHKTIEVDNKTTKQDNKVIEPDTNTIESDDYKLTINGFAADKHCVYISYDIEYKNPLYFENGELKQEVLEWSPVSFRVEPQMNYMPGGGRSIGGKVVSVDGMAVSYVAFGSCSNDFLAEDKYLVKISYSCGYVNSDGIILRPMENDGVFSVDIPATKDITLTVNEEITCPDGREGILNKIELNSLSAYLFMTTKEAVQKEDLQKVEVNMELFAPKLIFKDGTVLDLAAVEPESRIRGCGDHRPSGQDVEEYYYYIYGTVIAPESIEAVEILGKTYAVQ